MLRNRNREPGRREQHRGGRRGRIRDPALPAGIDEPVGDEEIIRLLEIVDVDGNTRQILRDMLRAGNVDTVAIGILHVVVRVLAAFDSGLVVPFLEAEILKDFHNGLRILCHDQRAKTCDFHSGSPSKYSDLF